MIVFDVVANSSYVYTGTIVDDTGAPIGPSRLSLLTLTLTDRKTGTVTNGRNQQDVLNTNGVTIDNAGKLHWSISPDDAHLSGANTITAHVAQFVWEWDNPVKRARHSFLLRVHSPVAQ